MWPPPPGTLWRGVKQEGNVAATPAEEETEREREGGRREGGREGDLHHCKQLHPQCFQDDRRLPAVGGVRGRGHSPTDDSD